MSLDYLIWEKFKLNIRENLKNDQLVCFFRYIFDYFKSAEICIYFLEMVNEKHISNNETNEEPMEE